MLPGALRLGCLLLLANGGAAYDASTSSASLEVSSGGLSRHQSLLAKNGTEDEEEYPVEERQRILESMIPPSYENAVLLPRSYGMRRRGPPLTEVMQLNPFPQESFLPDKVFKHSDATKFVVSQDGAWYASENKEKSSQFRNLVQDVIFLFVNHKSGGHAGQQLLELNMKGKVSADVEHFQFRWLEAAATSRTRFGIAFFNMLDKCERDAGKNILLYIKSKDNEGVCSDECRATCDSYMNMFIKKVGSRAKTVRARAVAGGGDGTVTWLMDHLTVGAHSVHVPIGVIPFGTGNDLSRQLNTPEGKKVCSGAGTVGGLKAAMGLGHDITTVAGVLEIAKKFIQASVKPFDLWTFTVEAKGYDETAPIHKSALGNIMELDGSGDNLVPMGFRCKKYLNDKKNCVKFEQTLGNYGSVGFDSLIGLEFEKWRRHQESTTPNKNKLQYGIIGAKYYKKRKKSPDFPIEYQPLNGYVSEVYDEDVSTHHHHRRAFRSNVSAGVGQYPCEPESRNDYRSLTFMNVECIAGGQHKWPAPRSIPSQPDFSDGYIEGLAFKNPISMAALDGTITEPCVLGQYQLPTITFQRDVPIVTTFQVDGEFYAVDQPTKVYIKKRAPVNVVVLGKGNEHGPRSVDVSMAQPHLIKFA
eukprot:jgi/Bigna1/90815/estExt_fgenesh1_pg.C_800037